MKKVLSTAFAALLVAGSISAFAGECTGCPGKKKGEKKGEKTESACTQQQSAETTQASASS